MKLGLKGVSVFVASGDSGVGAASGCLGNGSIFAPDFPASCPYVTAVGATYLPAGANVYTDEEIAVTSFGSGGGMIDTFLLSGPLQYTDCDGRLLQHLPHPILSVQCSRDLLVHRQSTIPLLLQHQQLKLGCQWRHIQSYRTRLPRR